MRAWKFVKMLLMVMVACVVFTFTVMYLWNWLMPAVFGLRTITWLQALGLLVLSKILIGGFHRHGGGGGRGRGWKRDMRARWERMTPEEKQRLKAGMRGRCGFGRAKEPVTAEERAG